MGKERQLNKPVVGEGGERSYIVGLVRLVWVVEVGSNQMAMALC